MAQYTVVRRESADWGTVPKVQLTHTPWLAPCPISATAQACHDGKVLYVRLEAVEENVRATLTGQLDQVCNDSCLEFFFAPIPGDSRYLNFECNPLGTLYLGFGATRETRVRQVLVNPSIQISPFQTESGWGVELAIPLAFIRLYFPEFTLSGESRANFFKCGDETEVPHYLSWAPPTCDYPDFHRWQDFGALIFE